MRLIYTALLYLLIPLLLVRLWWRGRKNPAYRQRWRERFGRLPASTMPAPIWLHAVSLGEVNAAHPLVKAIQKRFPEQRIVITTTTPTGSARVIQLFGDSVSHVYLPIDCQRFIARFYAFIKPKIVIIMETELWPNMLHYLAKKKCPVIIANARLSEQSFAGYKKILWLTRPMLQTIQAIAAQAEADASRLIAMGGKPDHVHVLGNIKFDIELKPEWADAAKLLRQHWGASRLVWVVASTHAGEDELLLSVFTQLKQQHPQLLLLLVPRHPERFDGVYELCRQTNMNVARRTQFETVSEKTDILVGDTLGEMMLFFSAADVVFMAGSFAKIGGHNALEPAALGLPIITGPHTFNFTAINKLMMAQNALVTVETPEQLSHAMQNLLSSKDAMKTLADNAREVMEKNRGAVSRHIELIERYFNA